MPDEIQRRNRFIWLCAEVLAGVLVVPVLFGFLWVRDIWQDRQHTVLVNSATPLYAANGDDRCGGTETASIQPGIILRVRRIRYWKDCATLDVALPDGQKGHIVLGRGDVFVRPDLVD